MADFIKFRSGTKQAFNGLSSKDNNTLYFLADTQELYKGEKLYGSGTRIQVGTHQDWLNRDSEILPAGTLIICTNRTNINGEDAPDFKIADGVKTVGQLPYITEQFAASFGITLDDGEPVFSGKLAHTLSIGEHKFDGSSDVSVPVYQGE